MVHSEVDYQLVFVVWSVPVDNCVIAKQSHQSLPRDIKVDLKDLNRICLFTLVNLKPFLPLEILLVNEQIKQSFNYYEKHVRFVKK